MLGTVAVQQPTLVGQAIERFGAERIVVGLDARDGFVATHGWQETSGLAALEVARRMADLGAVRAVYTDISRDGMLGGVNVAATMALAAASGLGVIASGGVGSLDDIRALVAADQPPGRGQAEPKAPPRRDPEWLPAGPYPSGRIEGVIVGQALYKGAFSLTEALGVAEDV